MNTLHLTDEQLHLVQTALDFYSRIGIGQFEQIKDHPSFQRHLDNACKPKRDPQVGDRTPQGEILQIKEGKALIDGSIDKKTGHWCSKLEWKKLKDVKLSTNYSRYHEIRKTVDELLVQPRNLLIQDPLMSEHGSWGIFNESVDDTCRIAFDIIQVIRHERWKRYPKRSSMTVDSSIHFSHRKDNSSSEIRCVMDAPEVAMEERDKSMPF
jgi:hypothetical protein